MTSQHSYAQDKALLVMDLLENGDQQIKQQNIGNQQKKRHDDSDKCSAKFIMTRRVESCIVLITLNKRGSL